MKSKSLLLCMSIATCLIAHASHKKHTTVTRSIPSSGAALGGNVPRNRPPRSMAEQLFDRYKPQPHQQPKSQYGRRI